VAQYLELLVGEEPGDRLLEIRFKVSGGMRQEFVPAAEAIGSAPLIQELAADRDVYVGVALRSRRFGGRDAVAGCGLAFVEIDEADAAARIESFAHRPTMVVSSGTAGHLHAYWRLQGVATVDEIERDNRRLAHRLGGDLASADAARILRPPGTRNHKHSPAVEVELVELDEHRRYELAELTEGLQDPPGYRPRGSRRRQPRVATHPLDRALLSVPAAEYVSVLSGAEQPNRAVKVHCPFHDLSVGEAMVHGVSPARSAEDASSNGRGGSSDPLLLVPAPVYFERLTGLRVGRSGKLHCLFHDDRTPSLHVYPEPGRGWFCFGCQRGGSVYDLAALLLGRETRGRAFLELRRELEELLL
jgi:hypothetical protein